MRHLATGEQNSPRRWVLVVILVLWATHHGWAENSWSRFPTEDEIQRAWETRKKYIERPFDPKEYRTIEVAAHYFGSYTVENVRFIPYHDPTVKDPVQASGVFITYDQIAHPRHLIINGLGHKEPGLVREVEVHPELTIKNIYCVNTLVFDKQEGWKLSGRGKAKIGKCLESQAQRDQFVSSIFKSNPPNLGPLFYLPNELDYNTGRDRKGSPYVRGWPGETVSEPTPAVVDDRLILRVKSSKLGEEWTDSTGQKIKSILITGSVESESPLTSSVFYRAVPNQKQGFLEVHGTSFTAKGEALVGQPNVFVLSFYNEADRNAEKTFTLSAEEQLQQVDESAAPDLVPGLGSIGDLPGPESPLEALVGVLGPGLVAILMGVVAGGPTPPSGSLGEGAEPSSPDPGSYPPGTEHTFSDGRSYREGESYTFHDGVKYEVRQGEFVPVKQLEQGERFVDPDGQERVWQGNQAWIPSDWEQQEQTNREYAEAHQADWEVESKRVNPHMAEAMEAIKQDFEMLENLEKMRHQVIFGPRELNVLAGSDTPGGGFRGKIDRVVADFKKSGKLDRQAYQQLRDVYGKARTGQILGERDLATESQIFAEAVRGGVEGFGKEVFAGVDSEGKTSYKSLAVRTLTAILTAGSSEMVYTPASSVYTMKDYVDRGGDSVVEGFLSTTKDVIKGEIIGRFLGRGTQAAGKRIGQVASKVGKVASRHFPKATRAVSQKVKALVDALTKKRRSPFDAKVQPPPRIPPKVSPRPSRAEVMERLKQYKAQQARPAPGLELNKESFTSVAGPPDLRGVPVRDQRAIQMVAHRHGVKAHFRPTNPDSKAWLESGRAHPKPEMLKTKTVSKLDTQLGFSKDKVGTVACKRPVMPKSRPPGMTDTEWADLPKRYEQRYTEFLDQQTKLEALVKKGEITWNKKTGEILNAKTGKPFAGDHDAFAFVDAKTGQPVSPAVNRQINQELQSLGTTSHGEHVAWDYSKLGKAPGAGAPSGAQSPYDIASGIDQKILDGHQAGGEALNTYDPLAGQKGEGWGASYWNGGQRVFQ